MSECYLARCQQDRKLIRKEFNKWTKNILLQMGKIKSFHFIKTKKKILFMLRFRNNIKKLF